MSTPISISELLEESKCYACYAPGSVSELARLALLARLAGSGGCTAPPDAPVITSVDVTSEGAYTIYWDAVAGATSYWVFVFEAPITDPPFQVNDANTTNTFAAFTDVDSVERATFVYAINDCGNSANSNTVEFFTNPAPPAPVAIAATSADFDSFTAEWEASVGAIGYYLDVATDSGFTSFVAGFNNLDVSNVLSYSVTGLSASTTYYYRIRSYDALQPSVDSNTISIATTINPSSITGLEYWSRSDMGVYTDAGKTTPATNGSLVYTWDNMGNTGSTPDWIQATSGSRPTYQTSGYPLTYPRLSFNADVMRALISAHSQPFTMVAVGMWRGGIDIYTAWMWTDSGDNQITTWSSNADNPVVTCGVNTLATTAWNGMPGYAIFVANGASSYFSSNGVDQGAFNSGANTIANAGITIGAWNSGTRQLLGYIYEVMLFNKALSVSELANLNAYLTARYLGYPATTDTFESYTAAADLGGLNGGTGWDAAYVSRTSLYITEDTFESYSAAANLDGLNAGTNWAAAYASRP